MQRPTRNIAWFFVLPALSVLVFSVVLPIMSVVNSSVQDVFAGNTYIWIGTHWFEKVLGSSEFHATLARSGLYSALVLCIEIPLGVFIAHRMPKSG